MPLDSPAERADDTRYYGNATVDENGNFVPIDPFRKTQLASYSLQPKVVPNYVIAKLALSQHKESLRDNNGVETPAPLHRHGSTTSSNREEEYANFMNDPFNQTISNGYADLLHAVKQPNEFTSDQFSVSHSLSETPLSDSPWGGDERLRHAIMGTSAGDNVPGREQNSNFLSRIFLPQRRHADEAPRVRSKAGYWMLDEKRKDLAPTLQRIFVQNPLVPLLLRVLMLIFSTCSLALAITIFINLKRQYDNIQVLQQPGTIFAIVVQSFAMVYIVYIAYDEYRGKPLGLRDPLGKLKLIMLDVFFMIFCSANLSLAFNSLFDTEWVCKALVDLTLGIKTLTVGFLCRRQRALVFFLLLIVFLWLLTFAISIIRVVDRVSSGPRAE